MAGMTTSATCPRCQSPAPGRYPHCPACMKALLAAGLCKWCGEGPRKPGSQYCEACQKLAVKALELMHPEERPGTYRDQDARENRRETRGGTDR